MSSFHWNTEEMSPNQVKIADYIQRHTREVLLSTEKEIAEAVGLSTASVSRFWKSVGYKNLKDFKKKMKEKVDITPAKKLENMIDMIGGDMWQKEFLTLGITYLQETIEHFKLEEFEAAVTLLHQANLIHLYCPGPTEGLADLLQYRLNRFGFAVKPMKSSGSELLESLLTIKAGDVIVLFGFIRMLPEARVIIDYATQHDIKTILITDQLVSDFNGQVDITLFASRGEVQHFHSMIAPTFIIESLIIALGKTNEQQTFERLHKLSNLRKRYEQHLPR